jgi:hypothetical protein
MVQAGKYYAFMICLFNTEFKSKIERKVAVLGVMQLLRFENDAKSQAEIMKFCIAVLGEQRNKFAVKPKLRKHRDGGTEEEA